MTARQAIISGVVAVWAAGCNMNGNTGQTVLGPASFYEAHSVTDPEERRQGVDAGGAIVTNPPILDESTAAPPAPAVTRISPAVVRADTAARNEPVNFPTTGPASLPSAMTPRYLTAGAVVVNVGDTPIYADKVLRAITPSLSSFAKEQDARAFQIEAQREITRQVGVMIRDELYYNTALQNLTAQEVQLAKAYTANWRKQQVTAAGGSEEQARARAKAEGLDFDEKVNDQYRVHLWQVYLQKKILPLVQVTADDIREYYTQHQNDFTEHEQVQFRLIKITTEASGGREQAIDKVGGLRSKLSMSSNDEFAREAAAVNDDRGLKQTGGRIGAGDGWLQRGSFAVKEVEDAVWNLQPGQTTEVIEVNNSFYIGRLEDRKVGRVRTFDDQTVQQEIRNRLRQPQIEARQKLLEDRLRREAVIYPENPNLNPVLEMAMQKYPEWRGK